MPSAPHPALLPILQRLQVEMDYRYACLRKSHRPLLDTDPLPLITVEIDECAHYATAGDEPQRELFSARLRDLIWGWRPVSHPANSDHPQRSF
jgi:hypothetical protein